MGKFLKKSLTIFLTFSMLLSIICVGNAQEIVEYVPDSEFVLNSQVIDSLVGTDKKFNFKKPHKNFNNPLEYELFPEGSPKPEDILQGKLGICYLLAVLSSIAAKHPEIIKNAIKDNEDGTVTVKIYDLITAQPKYVKVDKTIPDLPKCCALLDKECLWVEVLIKALMAVGLTQRACANIFFSMEYENIEGGFAAPVLKMLTGKDVCIYKDIDLVKKGSEQTYNIIKDALEKGSGIITCTFNHNRFHSVLRTFLRLSASDNGLVYNHAYSVVDAFEDESKEKWIVVRNPWGLFSSTYNNDKRCIATDDDKYQGYSTLKLKDFYKCCDTLQVLTQDALKPMTIKQELHECTDTAPFILLISLVPYSILSVLLEEKISVLPIRLKIALYFFSMGITELIFW